MKKIPALFARDADGDLTREYNPKSLWVPAGEGVATRKWDGTAVLVRDGVVYARYDAKHDKPVPLDWWPAQLLPDPITGHWPGWVPATRHSDVWIREAAAGATWQDGTYEACGPMIGGNPEHLAAHTLIRHGDQILYHVPTTWEGLSDYLAGRGIEGIVWWRDIGDPECDKVKITAAALGVPR